MELFTQMGDGDLAKTLLPYLRRADEIQKYEPLVAYYCRLYAKNRMLEIPVNEQTRATKRMLSNLREQLMKDTDSVQLRSTDSLYIEKFALSMFMRADLQERRGKADLRTAKTFYAASLFFEILHSFGQVSFDVVQKQKYAAWRAAEIRKTLKGKGKKASKQVRHPSAPLFATDKTLLASNGETTNSMSYADADLPGQKPPPAVEAGEEQHSSLTLVPNEGLRDPSLISSTVATPSSSLDREDETDDDESFYDCSDADLSELSSSDFEDEANEENTVPVDAENQSNHPSTADMVKAQKVTRLAVSALAFDNIPSAISYLEQALDLLTKNCQATS